MHFKKAIFIIFSLIIFIQAGFGQSDNSPVLPKSAANLQDFVPTGWKIANQLENDLDSDSTIETILVLQGNNPELIKEGLSLDYNVLANDEKTGSLKFLADNNPVILAVLSKEKESYKLIVQNNQIIPRFADSWYFWKHSVSLENKTLKVELNGKVSSGIMDNFGETKRVYKFQMRNSKLVLTEAEETFWFQAMLARNGRKDRFEKHNFIKKKGFVYSTVSLDKKPAKEKMQKIGSLIPFEKITADSISKLDSLANIKS